MKLIFFAVIFSLCSGCALTNTRNITVSGAGEIEVVPDMAAISMSASNLMENADSSFGATTRSINALTAGCRELGIEERDIKTSHISINKEYQWVNNTQTFAGYRSVANVNVTVRKLDLLGKLTQKVLESGSNEISGITYDHSRYDSLYNAAGIVALKKATAIARSMCAEMGIGLGKVLRISNEPVAPIGLQPQDNARGIAAASFMERKAAPIEIKPGILKISNVSYVIFGIR